MKSNDPYTVLSPTEWEEFAEEWELWTDGKLLEETVDD